MANNQLPADLEEFVSKEVASLCDADPAVLAQYIIALIGNEERNDALKANLQSQLNEFFDDQTIPFIDRLFAKINNANTKKSGEERFRGDYSDEEDDGDRNFKHRRQRSDSRDEEHERGYKRRSDDYEHNGSSHHTKYQRGSGASPNSIPVSGYNSPSYDARRGPNNRTMRGGRHPTNGGRGQTRPQCRDYNEKGFCMRGDLCPYDHGMDRIIVDEGGVPPFPNVPFAANAPVTMGHPKPPFFGMSDAYDPERSGLVPGHDMNFTDMRGGMMHRGRGRGGRGGYQRHLHQNKNPQNTTLVVEKIPVENCQISTVNDYFAKFGTITNISVQPQAQKAIIQYSTRAEAEKAYSSPDVIFDNRFVKVYWSKEDTHGTELPATTPTVPPKTTPANTEPDPELVAKRAAEIAAAREEKQKKHQEHMKHILEIQKKRETQLQQQIDEQKRLLTQLTDSANMSTAEKAELLKALKKIQNDIDISKQAAAHDEQESKDAPAETTEDLKKKLARLEAEAAHLGIHTSGSFRGGRGGYYGRGRGSWPRMRGGMTRMTLDNRPTKIHITSIPEASTETELRQHFEQFGHVTLFEQKENEADVQYSQRFEAEKAMSLGPNYPKGSLQLAWSTNNTPESNQTTTEES